MGRHQKNPVRKYFEYNAITQKSTCKAENGCDVKINGNHAGNMKRHVQSCHKDLYTKLFTEGDLACIPNKNPRLQESSQRTLDSIVVREGQEHVKVNINSAVLKRACTELITVNGRPFSIFLDSGFRRIVDPILQALKPNWAINAQNIKQNVAVIAKDIRTKIKDELKGKLIPLKVDSATRLDRSILGINIQIVKNDKLVLRTLAMREMKQKHESSYIASIISDVLQEYNVDLKQIISITTDNGANMLKAVSILSDTQNSQSRFMIDGEDAVVDYGSEIAFEENDDNENSDECEVNENLDFETLQSNLESGTNKIFLDHDNTQSNNILRNIRCAAHTVALSVNDALKDKIVSGLISTARSVCKKLRTTTMLTIIKRMKLLKPILDCPTRWNSTHDMLERLLLLKSFCQDMAPTVKELHITENNWDALNKIVMALKPAKIATKLFQDNQLLAGDFYCSWLTCKNETKKINTRFAKSLLNFMNEREKMLLNNDAFTAAILLDPRYKVILTDIQIENAKNYINQAWCILTRINFEMNNNTETENSHLNSLSVSTTSQSSKEEDDIETFLKQKDKNITLFNNLNKNTNLEKSIYSSLNSYIAEPRQKRNCNILEFWNIKKNKETSMKEVCDIATNILSLPMTQVSVERAFSALKYILNCQRSNLNEELLEDILLIRLNEDLF